MYEGTAHHGVGRIANSMKKVHAVFHAPQGDDYVNPIFTMLERTPAFPQMTTSIVSGRDLAQGTIRLPETLRQVEAKLHPELIIVCASCSTILLQEDLQTVADSAGVNAEVLVYDANPYRMQEIVAADKLFTLLVKKYVGWGDAPVARTPYPSVNIIGPASLGFHVRTDLICLRRILQTLGVQINVVAPLGAGLDDLARLPAAWVNIAPYRELGAEAARYLEATFGTPTLYDAPIGVQPTLRWLRQLVDTLNGVGRQATENTESTEDLGEKINNVAASELSGRSSETTAAGAQVNKNSVFSVPSVAKIVMPPLTAFSLDGMSAPSGVPWFARTADMESFSSKKAFVFGDATHTVGIVKFLRDELGMQIAGAGTYLAHEAEWVSEQLVGYLPQGSGVRSQGSENGIDSPDPRSLTPDPLLVTDRFQEVAARIEELQPDLVCGTQMERHSCRKLDIACMVIAPPTHIENHLLGYRPMLGFDGADVIADEVYTTTKLGLEKHLIDLFGDAGLEYENQGSGVRGQGSGRVGVGESGSRGEQETGRHGDTETVGESVEQVTPLLPHTPTPLLPEWTDEAQAMLKKVPFFVRKRVQRNVEKYAAANGCASITADVMLTAKEALGG
jgi:light-independent protochlorophyllide reductase subunit B